MDLFRERLACAIKQSGLSQRKISASIGKSSGYLTNVLNGNSTPSIEVISTLCHLLKVSPNYLCVYDHGLFLKTSEKAFEEPAERIIGELMQVVAARLESNEPTFEDIFFGLNQSRGSSGICQVLTNTLCCTISPSHGIKQLTRLKSAKTA